MALGDFSPSNMAKLILSLDDAMNDSRVQQRHNLMPEYGILEAIKSIETANWNSVRPTDRYCEEFDVTWLEESDNEASLLTNQAMIHRPLCDIDGEELQSAKKSYKIDKVLSYTLKVKDEDCGNIFDYESKIQLGLLQGYKKLIQRMAKAMPGYLSAFAGTNLLNGAGFNGFDWNIGTADGTNTEIEPADLTLDKAMFYLTRLYQINKLQNPKIVDGGIFAFQNFLATIQKGTGAGDVGMANAWQVIANQYMLDFVNMYAGGYPNSAFIIDQGNLALPIVSFFPRLGGDNEVVANKYIYSVPVPGFTLGGQTIYVDMTYTKEEETLAGTSRCQLVHNFNMELKFNLWQAPKYQSDTVTGVIQVNRGEAA